MAAEIATDLNGEPRNEDEGKTRKVYVIERKEVMSYSYYVIADNQKEALEMFENEDYKELESITKADSQGVYQIDGSFNFHRYMKPTVLTKFKQELKPIKFEFTDYAPLGWQDMEGESRW